MEFFTNYQNSYKVLPGTSRWKFWVIIAVQCLICIMDLLGIYLLSAALWLLNNQQVRPESSLSEYYRIVFNLFGNFDQKTQFVILISITAILFIGKSLFSALGSSWMFSYLSRIAVGHSSWLSRNYFALPIFEIRTIESQKAAQALNYGINTLILENLSSYAILVSELFLIFIITITIFVMNWTIALILFCYFGLIAMLIYRRVSRIAISAGNARIEADINGNSLIVDLISGYRDLFILNRIEATISKFTEYRKKSIKASRDIALSGLYPKYILESSMVFSIAILAIYQLVVDANSSSFISTIVIFFAGISRILPSLLRIQTAVSTIKTSERTSKFTRQIANLIQVNKNLVDEEVTGSTHYRETQNSNNSQNNSTVIVTNLSFKYPNKIEFAVKSVNFEVKENEIVAFVGKSGSGKSTMIDLLIGLIEPGIGSVKVYNSNPKNLLRKSPGKIGLVPQDVELFNSSLAANVGLIDDEIDVTKVIQALKYANAMDFVNALPYGIYTIVGERGLQLSGGQRQRLGIARALYADPELLVFDEATSALDAESEFAISETLIDLSKQKTVIVVAHRLSTVKRADRIYFWENGEILASGTFEELRAINENFAVQAGLLGL